MKITLFHLLLIMAMACNQGKKHPVLNARIDFEKDSFNFNTIKKGDSITAAFVFKNTGTAPLRIQKPGLSCGCTKAIYDSLPILPGEKRTITIIYNSSKDSGRIVKTVVVESNTLPALHVLYLSGNVW
jgi:Protein of unknown function (DUF1573)